MAYANETKPSAGSYTREDRPGVYSYLLTPLNEYILVGSSENEPIVLEWDLPTFTNEPKP